MQIRSSDALLFVLVPKPTIHPTQPTALSPQHHRDHQMPTLSSEKNMLQCLKTQRTHFRATAARGWHTPNNAAASSLLRSRAQQQVVAHSSSSSMAQETQPQQSSVSHSVLLQALRRIVPELTYESYKGQSGKVGVVGGCREYTGAPYFAAMSAMRMGVDLAYVFCTPSAAPVIKGYSPELIVMPMLAETPVHKPAHHTTSAAADDSVDDTSPPGPSGHTSEQQQQQKCDRISEQQRLYLQKCETFIDRLSVLIIGPGLGDDAQTLAGLSSIISRARQRNIPLIIDGSGLNFIAGHLGLIRGYTNCILTPNIAEFGRLAEGAGVTLEGRIGTQWQQHAQELATALGGPLLLSKGQVDIITDGQQQLVVTADGSPRRCGGQGDVLTGTIATFISWQKGAAAAAAAADAEPQQPSPLMLAAYGGCLTMRAAAVLTYAQKGRSMVAGDMIEALGDPVLQHCGLLASKL